MLVGCAARRGIDFRGAHADHKPLWNALFAAGLLASSMAQGWMLGSYVTGFDHGLGSAVQRRYRVDLPAAHAMLGAGWLIMKTDGAPQARAVAWGLRVFWPMLLALAGISWPPLVSATVFAKWFSLPSCSALAADSAVCAAALWALHHVLVNPAL